MATSSPAPVFSPRSTTTTILHPSGAEGGVEAITARRRNSGSFKHMSTGGLVSNSPFHQKLGGVKSPGSPAKSERERADAGWGTGSNGGGGSRIPTFTAPGGSATNSSLGRKTSNGGRKVSGEMSGPVKENSNPSDLNELANPRSRSTSPAVSKPTTSAPFKPTRPTFGTAKRQPAQEDFDRRQSSSYAALRKNGGLVTSSPFTSGQARSVGIPTLPTTVPSPELDQVPYEIGKLAHESAPFGYHDMTDEIVEHESALPPAPATYPKPGGLELGLGARPGTQLPQAHDRRIVASGPPPPTPPRSSVEESITLSPNGSAMSPIRRGMRGPRPMGQDGEFDDGDETEREELSRPLRRQPSNKTVTWAETEEVLEFEVEEERRRSMMSDASTLSDDDRRYSSDEYDDEDYDRPYPHHQGDDSSYSYQEGGSIEVHSVDGDSDNDESVVSTTSSTMEDIMGQIDDQISEFKQGNGGPFRSYGHASARDGANGYSARPAPPASAFSVSSASAADDGVSEVNSASSYDDDEEDVLRSAKEYLLNRSAGAPPVSQAAPGSPVRPRLPSPPTPTAQLQPALPITSNALHLRAPVEVPTGMAQSDSQYSLPDIPGTSPFLGFGDDGTAESVSSISPTDHALPSTQPLSPRRVPALPSSPPSQSTPRASSPSHASVTSRSQADSPILGAFDRLSLANGSGGGENVATQVEQSPLLSRKASLIGSDVTSSSISWYGSGVNGSLRGGTVRLGRDRLDERKKAHQALLDGTSTSFGAFPSVTSPDLTRAQGEAAPVGPFSREMENTQSAPASSAHLSRAIEARPAAKPRSATLSSSMMPTIAASAQRSKLGLSVGAPLTADVAEEMASPLERLQRGMESRPVGDEWRSGDSLLGVADVANGPIDEDDEDQATAMQKTASEPRPRRRRSRSTGDADLAETNSAPMEATHTMPELGFQKRATHAAFASNVLESLDDIYNSRNRTYRVRESKQLVVVSDINGHKAGDVDPGRAWRKKRPSDVHGLSRSMSTVSVSSRRQREHSGQLFVCLRDVHFDGVPMPRERVNVSAALDNGRQRVEAAVRELAPKVTLKKEFELVCSENLTFSIHFSVPNQPPPPAPVVAAPSPPLSPSKTSRGFRIFSSPKKKSAPVKAAAPPPTPDPFYDYLSADGKLATATIAFVDQVSKCRLQKARITVPFTRKAPSSPRSCGGSLVVDLLFVPAIPGMAKASLAKSMEEVVDGLERADWATKVTHEGVLTQLGGDCTVWRRRNVKLRGNMLVPYSEVTKRSHVEINLGSVTSLEDLNVPAVSTSRSRTPSYDEDEDVGRMDNSFRLHFKDGGHIDFFADTDAAKKEWIASLEPVVGTDAKKGPPEWAVAVRKLPVPSKA
ncbi:hypothetical protein JCM10212_005985 [Sporobolomyces blumeae]